ncbi:MAG: FABP family protein [Antricoccus sp.]
MINPHADLHINPPDLDSIDSVDVRTGAEVDPGALSLLPLLGVWRGVGEGDYPGMGPFRYGQLIRFFHDGRPFLGMQSHTWILGADDQPTHLAGRESGWWRPGTGDDIEVILTAADGIVATYAGLARTSTSWDLTSDLVARVPGAPEITAEKRLYGIVDGDLMYAIDMAAFDQPLQPHISARLKRVQ